VGKRGEGKYDNTVGLVEALRDPPIQRRRVSQGLGTPYVGITATRGVEQKEEAKRRDSIL